MIIFGHTPREWRRRALNNKALIVSHIVMFILGGIIF
jgi:hypothetical protein